MEEREEDIGMFFLVEMELGSWRKNRLECSIVDDSYGIRNIRSIWMI